LRPLQVTPRRPPSLRHRDEPRVDCSLFTLERSPPTLFLSLSLSLSLSILPGVSSIFGDSCLAPYPFRCRESGKCRHQRGISGISRSRVGVKNLVASDEKPRTRGDLNRVTFAVRSADGYYYAALKYDRSRELSAASSRAQQLYPLSLRAATTVDAMRSSRCIIVVCNPFVPITRLTAIRIIGADESTIFFARRWDFFPSPSLPAGEREGAREGGGTCKAHEISFAVSRMRSPHRGEIKRMKMACPDIYTSNLQRRCRCGAAA